MKICKRTLEHIHEFHFFLQFLAYHFLIFAFEDVLSIRFLILYFFFLIQNHFLKTSESKNITLQFYIENLRYKENSIQTLLQYRAEYCSCWHTSRSYPILVCKISFWIFFYLFWILNFFNVLKKCWHVSFFYYNTF